MIMKNDINMLSEHIMDLDNLKIEYNPKVIESLKEIREWSMEYVSEQFNAGLSLEDATKKLSTELNKNYPNLTDETIYNIFIYVHFYLCR